MYTMGYYSARGKTEILHEEFICVTRTALEGIMLSEVSTTERRNTVNAYQGGLLD